MRWASKPIIGQAQGKFCNSARSLHEINQFAPPVRAETGVPVSFTFVLHMFRRRARENGQTVCKPGSVQPRGWDGHSSGTRLAAGLARPTRATGREHPRGMACAIRRSPLFGLAPGGVCRAAPVAGGAGRSCRSVSPLPARSCLPAQAVCFLWHFPWGHPRRRLAGTVFPWSPDFPPPGLPPAAAVRPSGVLQMNRPLPFVNRDRAPPRQTGALACPDRRRR